MARPQVRTSSDYFRALAKLSIQDRKRADKALMRFIENPGLPGLHFEPIHGEPGLFTIRAGRAIRVVLRRDEDSSGVVYTAVNAGTHTVYRRQR